MLKVHQHMTRTTSSYYNRASKKNMWSFLMFEKLPELTLHSCSQFHHDPTLITGSEYKEMVNEIEHINS